MAALTAPECQCPIATNPTHTAKCEAAWDAYTDALLTAEAADAQAAVAATVEEIDAAVDALRAVPAIRGRNSRPAILALLKRRTALTRKSGTGLLDGPVPCDWFAAQD